jgi:subtilase family serine protease
MRNRIAVIFCLQFLSLFVFSGLFSKPASAQRSQPLIKEPIDDRKLVTLEGNTTPAAQDAENDRGRVDDNLALEHLLLTLKRSPADEARLAKRIDAMHDIHSPEYHRWMTPQQLGDEFGASRQDLETVQSWLASRGFTVNHVYQNGMVIDFSGTAGLVRQAFHTEIHNLALPNGESHVANMSDPQIPAALVPVVNGVGSLHDFFPKPHHIDRGQVSYNRATKTWTPRFNVPDDGFTDHTVSPYDFATIYNLLPLWNEGFTGKGVTIATVEDSDLANTSDWSTFRSTFDLSKFTQGNFKQIFPSCKNPGANGDEIEAALDVEWASAAAPDANIELSACGNTKTTSGLDLAILNLIDTTPPDIISDSYGLCETITGAAEIALENSEAQMAVAEGITFFIAQGDTGADECAPNESTNYSTLGINSGDNTASIYAVDIGGTDFMAQYDSDVNGVPLSNYWSATNDSVTLASALSYIPEIPWNDSCTSVLIYTDPVYGSYTQPYGATGFCASKIGKQDFLFDVSGSGGPSTCFTGKPAISGVVGGTCQGNPKPLYQSGVPGIPNDGLRDQPDLSLFAADGIWGSYYVECMSDKKQGGAACTANNDALLEGGGGTSFGAPAMAGIQALINQANGKQGNANYVYYALAAAQFTAQGTSACNASQTNGSLPASTCVFNDVTRGDMDIPCGAGRGGKFYDCFGAATTRGSIGELSTSNTAANPAYPATIGYDLATGLGSVNATNLFNAWPKPPAIAH